MSETLYASDPTTEVATEIGAGETLYTDRELAAKWKVSRRTIANWGPRGSSGR